MGIFSGAEHQGENTVMSAILGNWDNWDAKESIGQ